MDLGKVLVVKELKDKKSVKIMDKFEEIENETKKYNTLCIYDLIVFMDDLEMERPIYGVSLLIQRANKFESIIKSNLTFTRMKTKLENYPIDASETYSKDSIDELLQFTVLESYKSNKTKILKKYSTNVFLETPIEFRAQNSSNRRGYGNRYYWDELEYEGTLYGETTQYAIIGFKFTSLD